MEEESNGDLNNIQEDNFFVDENSTFINARTEPSVEFNYDESEEKENDFYFEAPNTIEIEKEVISEVKNANNDKINENSTNSDSNEKIVEIEMQNNSVNTPEWDNNENETNMMNNETNTIKREEMNYFQRLIYFEHFQNSSVQIFLVLLLVTFEILLMISGFFVGKPYTFVFCLTLLLFPIFWIYLVYFRNNEQRNSTPPSRLVETFAIAFFVEALLFFFEWSVWYAAITITLYIFDNLINSLYLLWILVFVTIILTSFFLQAFFEETTKYLILFRNSKTIGFQTRYSIILYAITASLAFALLSGTLSTVLIYWEYETLYAIATLFIEGFLTTTMHVITGTWIGIGYVKHIFKSNEYDEQSIAAMLTPPIFLHGCYACLISSLRTLYPIGQISWRLYFLVIICASIFLFFALVLMWRKVQKIIKNPHLYHSLQVN